LKVAAVAPAGTVTGAGTVRYALVSVSMTSAPPTGAALVSVTVQVLEPFCPRLVGLQANDNAIEAARLMVKLPLVPLYLAVIVELELLARAAVVALKVAVVAAANTVTDVGTVRVGLVFVRVTLAPPAGAAFVRVTVHALDEFAPILVG
jgi:hypothetical protein